MNDWKLLRERKKNFRSNAIPVFRIEHTRWFAIKGGVYQVLGQKTTASSLLTNYQVIDQEGNEAPQKIAEEVYTYVTKIQLLTEIVFLRTLIEDQKKALKNKMSQYLIKQYEEKTGEKLERFISTNKSLASLLFTAHETLSAAKDEKTPWDMKQLRALTDHWEQVRKAYEKRIPQLQAFHQFIHDEQLAGEKLPAGLDELYEEADTLLNIFAEAIHVDPKHLTNLNHFIAIHSSAGYYTEAEADQKAVSITGKLSHAFLSKYSYFLVLILSIIIVWKFGLHLLTGMGIGYLFILSGIAHFFRNTTLKSDMNKKITELRTRRVMEDPQLSQLLEKAYDLPGAGKKGKGALRKLRVNKKLGVPSIIIMLIGVGISLFAMITYQSPLDWILILFGFVLIFFGWMLPRFSELLKNIEARK